MLQIGCCVLVAYISCVAFGFRKYTPDLDNAIIRPRGIGVSTVKRPTPIKVHGGIKHQPLNNALDAFDTNHVNAPGDNKLIGVQDEKNSINIADGKSISPGGAEVYLLEEEAFKPSSDEKTAGADIQNLNWNNTTEQHHVAVKSEEKHHVVFLKVHKAASSTLSNILMRFALSHDLNVILKHKSKSAPLDTYLHLNNTGSQFYAKDLVPTPLGLVYDILCTHVIFNKTQISPYFPPDTVYIGIVREPFSQFISSVKFFHGWENHINHATRVNPDEPVEEFLNKSSYYIDQSNTHPSHRFSDNRMGVDFGFPLEDFEVMKHNKTVISEFIRQLNATFDLVLIVELFDESLVLMKRYLNWKTADILYMKVNAFDISQKPNLRAWKLRKLKDYSQNVREKFEVFATLDILLYDHFLREMKKKIDAQPPDFYEEVAAFKELRSAVSAACKDVKRLPLRFPSTPHIDGFILSKDDCHMMHYHEITMFDRVHDTQVNKLKTITR